jgi:hypothetical protein
MSERPPDFDELVGADLEPEERERLHRVHELLVTAGPPPKLPAALAEPRATVTPIRPRRRRRIAVVALAAALGAAVFAAGALVAGGSDGRAVDFAVDMSGTASAVEATATLDVFEIDEAGNWPMELRVRGLAPASSGRPYELWLTRNGRLAALCGSFLVEPAGTTAVPLNAPYKLKAFDGWVVVEEGSRKPLLTT